MNKELTPLEAFKEIKELAWLYTDDSDKTEERINMVEKSLEALEIIKKYKINIQKCYEVFYKNNWFRGCNDTHEVWDLMNEDKVISGSNLPYEVYDLLLEVLL